MSQHTAGPDPAGSRPPEPTTLAAVKAAGARFGYSSHPAGDRLIFPWNDHRVTVFLMGGHGLVTDDPETLIFDTLVRGVLDLSRVNELAGIINEWNRERLGPTLSFRMGPEGDLVLHARAALQVRHGLTPIQLASCLHELMETIQLAVTTLLGQFPELAHDPGDDEEDTRQEDDLRALQAPLPGALKDDSIPDLTLAPPPTTADRQEGDHRSMSSQDTPDPMIPDPAEHPEGSGAAERPGRHRRPSTPASGDTPGQPSDPSTPGSGTRGALPRDTAFPEIYNAEENNHSVDLPSPVTLDRVRESLVDLGVPKTRGDDEVIVAWVNEVLFGFFIDNGPSYLIKGHWDPNLDPERDFLRIFLLCNDWNESAINTKAFCHTDGDGLQVRVEFTAPVGEGLNDAQLGHNTEVAINQVLHALDSISSEAVGQSVVRWPHPGLE